MGHTSRRVSYVFLWMVPVLAIGFAAVRALRVPGVYHSIGGMLFAAIAIAAWILGARAIRGGVEGQQRLALAGGLLLIPFALIALFWVGLGPPWGSTPAENVMRYQVLLVSSIAVTIGFVILRDALSEAGERCYSALGFATIMLAGAAYLLWMSLSGKSRYGDARWACGSRDCLAKLTSSKSCLMWRMHSNLSGDGSVCGVLS